MSSSCPTDAARILALGAAALTLAACQKGERASAYVPAANVGPQPLVSELLPGGAQPPPQDPRGKLYDGDAASIAQGKQYFAWYNCSGCHFNGGGGIGPAFMDKTWRYGGSIDQIYSSIAQGRPNGMPTWGAKIPDTQIWQIAAYVRSLSSPQTQDIQPPSAPPAPTQPPADPNHQGGSTTPS